MKANRRLSRRLTQQPTQSNGQSRRARHDHDGGKDVTELSFERQRIERGKLS
jgi:hypothetical protein